MKNDKGLTGRPQPQRNQPPNTPANAGRTVSLQPMFVTNRTTIEEIDNHLSSAETRIVVITIEKTNRHGEAVVQHIGSCYSDVRIVLVCEGTAQDILALAFKPGVWACVSRQSSVETLREAIDTVAAGDCFNGGLAHALGGGADLTTAARFAAACGALSTTRRGAAQSAPILREVEAFLRQHGP